MSEYLSNHKGAIADLQYAQRSLTDTDFIDEDIRMLEHELEITSENGSALIATPPIPCPKKSTATGTQTA